jgi:hypothetical protein
MRVATSAVVRSLAVFARGKRSLLLRSPCLLQLEIDRRTLVGGVMMMQQQSPIMPSVQKESVRIAVVQLNCKADKNENFEKAVLFIRTAVSQNSQVSK